MAAKHLLIRDSAHVAHTREDCELLEPPVIAKIAVAEWPVDLACCMGCVLLAVSAGKALHIKPDPPVGG